MNGQKLRHQAFSKSYAISVPNMKKYTILVYRPSQVKRQRLDFLSISFFCPIKQQKNDKTKSFKKMLLEHLFFYPSSKNLSFPKICYFRSKFYEKLYHISTLTRRKNDANYLILAFVILNLTSFEM